MIVMIDGQRTEVDWPVPEAPTGRQIPTADFLALWTADMVARTQAADPNLNYAMLQVMLQPTVNLDSPDLPPLLSLAVSMWIGVE